MVHVYMRTQKKFPRNVVETSQSNRYLETSFECVSLNNWTVSRSTYTISAFRYSPWRHFDCSRSQSIPNDSHLNTCCHPKGGPKPRRSSVWSDFDPRGAESELQSWIISKVDIKMMSVSFLKAPTRYTRSEGNHFSRRKITEYLVRSVAFELSQALLVRCKTDPSNSSIWRGIWIA